MILKILKNLVLQIQGFFYGIEIELFNLPNKNKIKQRITAVKMYF